MITWLVICASIAGVVVSLYSLYIERLIAANPNYKPACDLSDRMSCSKPLTSPYGALLGMSNTYFGIVFYWSIIGLTIMGYDSTVVWLARLGVVASAMLAYILYFKIQSICLVCTSIYVINIVLLIASHMN